MINSFFKLFIYIFLLTIFSCNRERIVNKIDNYKSIGYLKDGKKQGKSKLFYENGTLKEKGRWDNDQQTGKWEYFDSLGNIIGIAYFKNNLQHGETKLYYPNGILKEESYWKNGLLNGLSKVYYITGILNEESKWKEGKKDGEALIYYENGNLQQKGNWVSGKQEGLFITFYENGDTLQKGNFIKGEKNGFFRTYHEHNKIYSIIQYENDLQSGETTYYYKSGIVEQYGLFKDNKPIGSWKFYNDKGELIKSKEF